jgi:uncharacterized protein YqiB (DUF1249 family)
MKKAIITGVSILTFAIIVVIIGVTASNKEIRLRSQITAQKQVCEAFYDKLWKVIAQKAQVAEQYKGAFKEIYPQLIEGRYGNEKGGTLMKWITESNPTFDVSLYKDLMLSIEAERAGFFMEQKRLVDLNNEHRIIRQTFPASMFIGGRADIEITIVSSDATKKVMETGKENDIEIFKK